MKDPVTLSYWQRTDRPATTHDVVVIGGGITGCSVAYWLKRLKPAYSIAIVESGSLAWGASGRNAGFLLQGGPGDILDDRKKLGEDRLRYIWELTAENTDLVERETAAGVVQFSRTGSYFCAVDGAETDRLRRACAALLEWGVEVEMREAGRLAEETGSRGFGAGLYFPGNATVHPVRLVRYIAETGGAQVFEHHRVFAIEPVSEGIRVHTPPRSLQAPRVVAALNAYTPRLLPESEGVIRPVRAQMFASAPQARRLFHPVYSHRGFFYVRQAEDGRVLAGGARHLHLQEEVGYADACSDAVQAGIEGYLRRHFPWIDLSRIECRWSGTMGFSPDGAPVIAESRHFPGLLWTGGFSGHGMAYGMAFGKRLAEYLAGASTECMDYFSAERSGGLV